MAVGQPSESIVRAAIEWQMRLRAEPASAELQRQLHDWLAQDEVLADDRPRKRAATRALRSCQHTGLAPVFHDVVGGGVDG